MSRCASRLRAVLLWSWASAAATLALAASPDSPISLRLRDTPLREVVWLLFQLTDQGYVVDGDVIGTVNVELTGVTPAEVERELSGSGVHFTGPGRIRRVSSAAAPDLLLPGTGFPISLSYLKPVDVRDFLRLIEDITGEQVLAPAGQFSGFSMFATEIPADSQLTASLAAAGLEFRREGQTIQVRRQGEPKAVLLPLNAGGLVGHVAYREGEAEGPKSRQAGIEGLIAAELSLTGLVANGGKWAAVARGPGGARVFYFQAGQRLYDGVIESIDASRVVVRSQNGEAITWRLRPEAEGITSVADDLGVSLERAEALMNARDFDGSERLLKAALGGDLKPEETLRVRAALADLHFQWSQSLAARGELEPGVRQLEAALEIDRPERPWQAAEDLNEIGKAWTSLNEPERAVGPHREALEIARSGVVRNRPQPFACVRPHERTPWIEADALDGLANAERARGRFESAATLYEQALAIWKRVADPTGRSAALTGLGLVRQGLGQLERAAALHREALALPARHPVVRAITLNNLGSAQQAMRQLDAALASFEEALGIYRKLEHRSGEGTVLNNLGAYWETRSDLSKACDAYAEALVASREADDRRGAALTRERIDRVIRRGSEGDESIRRCRSALEPG